MKTIKTISKKQEQQKKEIIDMIKKRRISMNMRQTDISALTGLATATICNMEANYRSVTMDSLIAILDALDLTLSITEKNNKNTNESC